jgi:hypothetical protein
MNLPAGHQNHQRFADTYIHSEIKRGSLDILQNSKILTYPEVCGLARHILLERLSGKIMQNLQHNQTVFCRIKVEKI